MNTEKHEMFDQNRNIRNYTWRTKWIRPYESLYSALRMFMKINVVSYSTAIKILSKGHSLTFNFDNLSNLKELPCSNTNNILHYCLAEQRVIDFFALDAITAKFPYFNAKAREVLLSPRHRYCPKCIKKGYHSWLYQYRPLQMCPIHRIPFEEGNFLIDQWAAGLWYHPSLQNIDTDPINAFYNKTFDKIKKVRIFTMDNDTSNNNILLSNFLDKSFNEIGKEIYSRRVDKVLETKKLIYEQFNKNWIKLFRENEIYQDGYRTSADIILKQGFMETVGSKHKNPYYNETFVGLLQIYITTMELTLENTGATQEIKELLNEYLIAVYGIPYHNPLDFHLIFHPYNSDYDYLQKSPAFVNPFIEHRREREQSRLNENDWALICIDDHIKYQWHKFMQLVATDNETENYSEIIHKLHNVWYLIIEDTCDILHVYRCIEE